MVLMSLMFAAGLVGAAGDAVLVQFPGTTFHVMNDPVMGGQSHSNWTIVDGSYGRFQGEAKNVSFLHAPGFCQASALFMFKDVSAYLDGGLLIHARSATPEYTGFKVAWGSPSTPRHHGGHELEGTYKAKLSVPASSNGEWQNIFVKFTDFSWDWSDDTGDCATKDPDGFQHRCCSKDASDVCPAKQHLSGVNMVSVWAEGVEGAFQIDIKDIVATDGKGDVQIV